MDTIKISRRKFCTVPRLVLPRRLVGLCLHPCHKAEWGNFANQLGDARGRSHNRAMVSAVYRYRPLPSPTWLRLLELKCGPASGPPHCSLKAFDRSQAPPYHALSYTWGHPLAPYSRKSKPRGDRRESIVCDDRRLLVTPNLHDALQRIKAEESVLRAGSKYLWIDAVCVNQGDVLERNAQVTKMSSTFLSAQSVIAWLGPEDQFTADAITLIGKISSVPEHLWQSVTYTDFFDLKWHGKVGIPTVTYENWLGFIALIDRPWFRRAWVVQELALAKSATLVCGSQRIDWAELDRTLAFITSKKWHHHLSTDKIRHVAAVQRNPGIYKDFLQSGTRCNLAAVTLAGTRRFNENRCPEKAPSLLKNLVYMHRHTEATDARDKVYAFLGLADKETASKIPVKPIEANYALPVGEVYTAVATNLLLSSNNLGLLSQVQDASHTKARGLPSWVPDYSAPLHPYPLLYRGNCHWSACLGLTWSPDADALRNDRLLFARGFCIDTIAEAAPMPDETASSAGYWAGIVNLALKLSPDYPFRALGDGTPAQSRVEVLWRTLTANTYRREHPAPSSCGALFLDYVLNLQIRHTLTPWSRGDGFVPHQSQSSFDDDVDFDEPIPSPPSADQLATRDQRVIPAWYDLLEAEPANSPYSLESYRARMANLVERMLRSTYVPVELAQLQHDLDMTSGDSRRVFRTEGGLLGAGPRSLQPGDEVWVLGGAVVPLVLRAVDGGRGSHRLVGESYVHGYMHANRGRIKKGGQVTTDVVLE